MDFFTKLVILVAFWAALGALFSLWVNRRRQRKLTAQQSSKEGIK